MEAVIALFLVALERAVKLKGKILDNKKKEIEILKLKAELGLDIRKVLEKEQKKLDEENLIFVLVRRIINRLSRRKVGPVSVGIS